MPSIRADSFQQQNASAPAKAGEVLWMRVPCGEGVASHASPESCVGVRKGDGEALTGVRAGWVSSPESVALPGCRGSLHMPKATPGRSLCESGPGPAGSEAPKGRRCLPLHARTHLTREVFPARGDPLVRKPGDPRLGLSKCRSGPRHESMKENDDDARAGEVGQVRSTAEVAED